jgi:hypothetical protein
MYGLGKEKKANAIGDLLYYVLPRHELQKILLLEGNEQVVLLNEQESLHEAGEVWFRRLVFKLRGLSAWAGRCPAF